MIGARGLVLLSLAAFACVAAGQPRTGGLAWTLLEDNADAVQQSVNEGLKFGVNEVQLSHDIIMDIDDVRAYAFT